MLVKDYKSTVSALEKELKEVRANPLVKEDGAAKQKLLAEIEQERNAKAELEKGAFLSFRHSEPF